MMRGRWLEARMGDGTVSTAPPHGEGENPVAGDQGGESGPPGRAAEPPGNAREPPLPAPVSGGVGRNRRLGPTVVAGSRAPRGAHGDAGGVALGWWSGFVERVPAPLPGGQGHRDFRLLPCRAKSVQRRQRLAGGAHPRLLAVVCRFTSPAAARPRAARAGEIGGPGRGHTSTPVCPANIRACSKSLSYPWKGKWHKGIYKFRSNQRVIKKILK